MRGFMIFEARKAKSGSETHRQAAFYILQCSTKLYCPSAGSGGGNRCRGESGSS